MKEYVVEVALLISPHVVPSVLICHWTVGVGWPLAAALKLAVDPDVTVESSGCDVTLGLVSNIRLSSGSVGTIPDERRR